jgi:probable HAF family extracellular repeat protein
MVSARHSFKLLLELLVAAAPVPGANRYKVTEIVLPAGADLNYPSSEKFVSINDQGVVAGWYHIQGTSYDTKAYRWENGVITLLPHLLGNETYLTQAYTINNQGQIAGCTATPASIASCLWQGAAPFTPAALPDGGVKARGINDLGQAVGYAFSSGGSGPFAVLWESVSRSFPPTLGRTAEAFGINEGGVIVGMASMNDARYPLSGIDWPVLWRDREIINLGDWGATPGSTDRGGRALAVNDHNQVVGYAHANLGGFGDCRAFLWENSNMTDLGALFEDSASRALAINNLGQIVGYSFSKAPPYGNRAVLWEKGSIINLNTKIDPIPDCYLSEAQAINNRGQIVCLAADSHGLNSRIFLLTPLSSPPDINALLLDD